MLLTLDASVWISAYAPAEPGHRDSRALVDALLAAGAARVQPTLFPIEVAGGHRADGRKIVIPETALADSVTIPATSFRIPKL